MNVKWVKRCVFHAKVEANTKKKSMKLLMDANCIMFTYARLVTNHSMKGNNL